MCICKNAGADDLVSSRALDVIMEDDLADSVKPGDRVQVSSLCVFAFLLVCGRFYRSLVFCGQ